MADAIQIAKGFTIPKMAKAAVYSKIGELKIDIKEVPVPIPGPGEVLVKISHSGICHSDLHVMLGEWPWLPMADGQVGGHEGVGTVVAVHNSVPSSMLNTRVGIKWLSSVCLCCEHCLQGRDVYCPNQKVSGANGTPGTFQEYTITDAKCCTPIPPALDPKNAAPLLCAGVTVYTSLKFLKLPHSSWVVLTGAGGGLGHLGIQYAHALGYKVLAIDAGSKKALCTSLGAEAFIDFAEAGEKLTERVHEITDGGAHAVLVVNASPKSYAQAPSFLRIGGQLVCVGIPGEETPLNLDARTIIGKDLRVLAGSVGTRQDAIEALEIAARGLVKTTLEVKRLEDLQDSFERLQKGQVAGRIVLEL
eukprot:Phypoly_transcript_12862.p1 GENE.Phypoly_transcript_12862~~Phypoly_transcript_12862.p1  ORF type:complete len:361 (-),score=48.66 Phypoly_transcript_12862:11-1093(-)